MTFGECYKHLEDGGFAAKKEWGDSFLWMKKKALVKSEWCKDNVLKSIADANGGSVEAEQTICKYDAANKKVITGFVPQQEDMASDSWFKTEPNILFPSRKKVDFTGDLFDGIDIIKKP